MAEEIKKLLISTYRDEKHFYLEDGKRKIDFVLVYKRSRRGQGYYGRKLKMAKMRHIFLQHLEDKRLKIEYLFRVRIVLYSF